MSKMTQDEIAGRCPDGKVRSGDAYLDAWSTYANKVAKALGGRPLSYNPGVLVLVGEHAIDVDEHVANTILYLLGEHEADRQEGEILMTAREHARSVIADCDRGLQRCHECPLLECCDNDSTLARTLRSRGLDSVKISMLLDKDKEVYGGKQ